MNNDKQIQELHLAFPDDPVPSDPIIETNPGARPWVRFWARSIDITVASVFLYLILAYFFQSIALDINDLIFGIMSLFIWIFVETFLLITWGATPGKWLLSIQIKTNNGQKPKFFNALKRSVKVWFFGLAIGIPFIFVFTLFCAYFELNINKITTWDRSEHFIVTHKPIMYFRAILAGLILCIPVVINIYALYERI